MKKKAFLMIAIITVTLMMAVGSAFAHGGHGWHEGHGSSCGGYHWRG